MYNVVNSKFETLLNSYNKFLLEQDEDVSADTSAPPMDASTPPADQNANPQSGSQSNVSVSSGYAYLVNIIYMLLRYKTENIDKNYLKLSDNEIIDSKTAYRYINVFTKLLSPTMVSDFQNNTIKKNETENFIDLDENTLIDLTNIARKSLFYHPKNTLEFSSKIDEIKDILSLTDNKVNINNAYAVSKMIKDFVDMNDEE